MSSTRLILRGLLVLFLLAMGYFAYRAYKMNQPEYFLTKAQEALNAGEYEDAINFATQFNDKNSDDGRGLAVIAQAQIEQGKDAGQGDYATNRAALRSLYQAARLERENLDPALQRSLLEALVASNRMGDAVAPAERVLKNEPENPDALYVLAFQATSDKQYQRAEDLLKQLSAIEGNHAKFRTLLEAAKLYSANNDQEKLQTALTQAIEVAQATSTEDLGALVPSERTALARLLVVSVAKAPDAVTATQRTEKAIDVTERTAKAGDQVPAANAQLATQLVALMEQKPLPDDAVKAKSTRIQLQDRAEALRQAAIAGGAADPGLYLTSAQESFRRGDHEQVAKILAEGFEAGKNLPESRRGELIDLHLLAARNLLVLRRYEEAKAHIAPLSAHEKTQGWANLLAGHVAMAEGRREKALEQYTSAHRLLGNTFVMRMALAKSLMALGRWEEALPYLNALHGNLDVNDSEQQALALLLKANEENIYWDQFRANLALGRWQAAMQHMAKLKGNKELEPRAIALAAAYLSSNGQKEQGQALLAEGRQQFPDNWTLLATKVLLLNREGKSDEAARLLEQAAKDHPENLTSQLVWVRWQIQNGKIDEAIELLDKMQERFPDSKFVPVFKAQTLLSAGRNKEALELAQQLAKSPETAKAGSALAAAAEIRLNNLDAAAEQLNLATGGDTTGTLALLQGQVAAAQGDFDAALQAANENLDVTALRDRAGLTLMQTIMAMAAKRGPVAAEAKLDELLGDRPEDKYLLMAKAELLTQQGKLAAALAALDRLAQVEKDAPTAPLLKAMMWTNQGRTDQALKEIVNALKINPRHEPSLVLAAQLRLAAGQYQAAIDTAKAALALNPRLAQLYLVQAQALEQLDKHDQAIGVLKDFVAKHPEIVSAHEMLAANYAKSGKVDEALKVYADFRKRFSLLPAEYALLAQEIVLLCRNDRLEQAIQVADSAAGATPSSAVCLQLAMAFDAAKQRKLFEQWAAKALELGNEQERAVVHMYLGNVAMREAAASADPQWPAKAREHFAAVIEKYPTDMVAGNNLAWLLATEFSEPDQAIAIAERVRGDATVGQLPANFLDTLAMCYRKAQRFEDAISLLQEALAINDREANLYHRLGLIQVEANKRAAARGSFERAIQLGNLPKEKMDEAKQQLAALDKADATAREEQRRRNEEAVRRQREAENRKLERKQAAEAP